MFDVVASSRNICMWVVRTASVALVLPYHLQGSHASTNNAPLYIIAILAFVLSYNPGGMAIRSILFPTTPTRTSANHQSRIVNIALFTHERAAVQTYR